MTLREELDNLSKPKLLEWANDRDLVIPEKLDKATILGVILDSPQAQLENYRRNTAASIAQQCENRGIPENEIDDVHAAIEQKYGGAIVELDMKSLTTVNRDLDAFFIAYLQGLKRRPGAAPRPAGLR